jgi:Zn-dependent M28 family amino/carboxypeptidase
MIASRLRRSLAPLAVAALAACAGRAASTTTAAPANADAPPALDAIVEGELRADLFYMAGDSMRGREAGTLDELRASMWVAERARAAGLLPAGDDGTYFQFWPMRRIRVGDASRASLDGAPLELWRDAAVVAPIDARIDLPLVWAGTATGAELAAMDLKGKAVAAIVLPPARPPAAWVSLRGWRYTRLAIAERQNALYAAGAAAVVLVADDSTDSQFTAMSVQMRRGAYNLDSAGTDRPTARLAALFVPAAQRARVQAAKRLALDVRAESFVYPSVNVVAKQPGTDAALRDEYVLFSGHNDHDGVRWTVDGDSIWNGADDNASVTVGLLGVARAFVKHPGRRSALFVFHGAEERGLIGSRWFVSHPTVPLNKVVAVLNADMIGRNTPDSAALLGVQPPHRNSSALVAMGLAANDRVGHFKLDTLWDKPTHAEGWYFRSDHLPYARAGVPALMFTTLLHPDYHTPRDDPDRIDVAKLTRMAQWMYATGWAVAETSARPAVDPGFKLER